MPVDVTSEIAQLETVLVHTPGPELEAVTPGNREDYLYDDIIDLEIDDVVVEIVFAVPGRHRLELGTGRMHEHGLELGDFGRDVDGHAGNYWVRRERG